jgi:ribonuclease G
MAKEICVSSTPHETRLAILEDDQLSEIYYERENEYTLAGSIYNGRVTRVLPGMQSAFVDIGLERDAFLYVTDFIDLEDQEETEELERAAISGAAQPPHEVRHDGGQGRNGIRRDERAARSAHGQPARHDTPEKDRGLASDDAPERAEAALEPPERLAVSGQSGSEKQGDGAQSGRRWRGRRHSRSDRGSLLSTATQVESEEPGHAPAGTAAAREVAAEIYAAEAPVPSPTPHPAQAQVPFVLPGESLSKYGGAAHSPQEPPERPRSASFSRPSTLIETPITWDGSGLLPGESLSRHRGRQNEPSSAVNSEPQQILSEGVGTGLDPQESTTQAGEPTPASLYEAAPAAGEAPAAEPDSSASHRVDPIPPASFRFFGLSGKKKKKEEEPGSSAPKSSSKAAASTYAPGAGLIEEEVIEGDEVEAPPRHRHHKAEEHELDDYEEETLPTQIRAGDLGDLLQEAQLDHRMQLNLADRNGEEEETFADEVDEEEEPAAESQRTDGQASAPARDRVSRGRRGRAGQTISNRRRPSRHSMQTTNLPVISDLLKPGQEILVQIAKEPIAKKGARITSHIALPGRFLVFMPTVNHIGVSRKIPSDEERQRLKRILMSERGEATGGFIVRTAAEGASEEELRADLRFLMNLWNDIKQRSDSSKSPALIYHDLSLIERILRDQVSANFSNIWVDSEADYERVVRFLNRFSPSLVRRVKLYTKETPLFEHFGIQDEISKALRSKVWLKSGGSIVINQTEALVAIDINTGKYVGKSARLEDTILKTNLDAVPEIVRQIRLRDLGGIIVIDFIDMDERKNRYKVMAALEEALKSDRAPTKVLQFNDFGLVAITRKRVKQSLERTLSVPCPVCQATGMVKSPTTVCNEIWVELRKMRKHIEGAEVTLRVNPETVKVLKSNNAAWLSEFEELIGKNILVKSDPTLHPEQFDIQG